ncbi:MAG: PBP1A family penicillin-binding protein [Pseudomonadota bacterium]
MLALLPRNRKSALIFTLSAGIVFGATVGLFLALTHDLPQIQSLEGYSPSATSRVWSSDNALLAELFSERRNPIAFSEIPGELINALIATEDRNFYHHSGVDLKGVLRAVIKDILAGEYVEGASTITQQLSKTLFLSSRKKITRKITEALLSIQIERRYTKNEILALYLNQVYFGSGAYGVSAAAQTFFGKSVNQLTLAECALIAATLKAPSRFSPLVNIDLARQRRNMVLKQMKETGMISDEVFESAQNETLQISAPPEPRIKAPYFIEYVKERLEEAIGPASLYRDGLTVRTTLSLELQAAAEAAAEKGLASLERRMRQRGIADPALECALIALDIPTGGILAMVGGRNFFKSAYNRAITAVRQPGSAFKPVVFAAALERGFAQNTLLPDASAALNDFKNGNDGQPENQSRTCQGEMTLREALTVPRNNPGVRLLERIGADSVVPFAHRLGIGTRLESDLSLALGASAVTLIDLTSAYAVFPGLGCKTAPNGIHEVTGRQGEVVWRAASDKEIVMSAANAAIMTDMLQGVMSAEGMGKKVQGVKCPLGGKSGTTDHYRDALFVGFSPSLAVGVWVGRDTNEPLGNGETGARVALPIWMDFMGKALATRPAAQFELPGDVIFLRMDPASGRLLSSQDEAGVSALFKKETELKK